MGALMELGPDGPRLSRAQVGDLLDRLAALGWLAAPQAPPSQSPPDRGGESAVAPDALDGWVDVLRETLAARGAGRGDAVVMSASIAAVWTVYLHAAGLMGAGDALEAQDVAYMMAGLKIARAAHRQQLRLDDPDDALDIGGYGLIAALCEGRGEASS
jgi:hypothetical protein